MSSLKSDLYERIEKFESLQRAEHRLKVEENHQYLLTRFPKDSWPSMTLNDYALGQVEHPENFCWAMEFKCRNLGSISGGNSEKHIIYYKADKGWDYDPALGANEQEAWETVRAGFLQLFEYADAGEWEKVDQIVSLSRGKAIRLKTLYVYFPEDILPVNSYAHIKYYLSLLDNPLCDDVSGDVVRLNRALLQELRSIPGTEKLSNHDLMVVLYEWSDAKEAKNAGVALSEEQINRLLQRFKTSMPDFEDFTKPGQKFKKEELDYKHAILERFKNEGGIATIEGLVEAGQGQEALKKLSKIVTSNLVSYQSWRPSFGETDEQITAVLSAFLQVAAKPYEKPTDLAAIFKACKAHKLKPAWDTLSTTLWALRPSDYFPVKISYYRDLANELDMPLPSGRPGQNNYARIMEFGRAFYAALEPYQPNDWVDVQSFMWCTCPRSETASDNHWVFQADPKKYDLKEALGKGEKINWSIKQHKNNIAKGDKVILWETGGKSGCYALATVCSDIYEQEDEYGQYKVDLEIDLNLAESPVRKKDLGLSWSQTFNDFNGGTQGTNLAATATHYNTLFEMGKVLQENRTYWVYAPGEQARLWKDNQQHNHMALGWDEIGDLGQYSSRQEIHNKLIDTSGKKDPKNDSLALWEFYQKIKPGDVVIAKKGNRKYLGYGIVTGGYEYDGSQSEYPNVRRVEWKKTVEKDSETGKIVLKTLTNINPYLEYIVKLKELIGIDDPAENISVKEPINQILYGPPGTGKTFALKNTYFDRYTTRQTVETPEQFADGLAGHLAWWEVLVMVMLDLQEAKVADILHHPLMQARVRNASVKNQRASIWGVLQAHTKEECVHVKYKNRTEPLLFEKSDKSVWSIDRDLATEEVPDLLAKLEEWKKGPSEGKDEERFEFTTFHQSYTYEDFIEGIKPKLLDEGVDGELGYELKEGVFKQIARKARANPSKKYALFIDEINRGNVASIFGELITLIELDKRKGGTNELSATLPYSREEFTVPGNLDIIATMNTADRSVEALDTALRRRFEFKEMQPKLDVIDPAEVAGVDLRKLLGTINARIERLLDKDHCIGHSYLIGLDSFESLQKAFANKILPLLEEYFYNDPARIGMVLGGAFVEQRIDGSAGIGLAKGPWQDDMDEERTLYTIHDPLKLKAADFQSIYDA